MNRVKAVKVAVECMVEVRQRRYAVDRNIAKGLRSGWNPTQERAVREYERITDAIKELEAWAQA